MNPINNLTESNFTTSNKGLMTLFIIGVVKIAIGIEFTSKQIAIPWMPTIELASLENLIFLYWGFVAYAIFRYSLHNITFFRQIRFQALGVALTPSHIGDKFVLDYIFPKASNYYCEIQDTNDDDQSKKINLKLHLEGELVSVFAFVYSKHYQFKYIECSVDPSINAESINMSDKYMTNFWSLVCYIDEDGSEIYKTQTIRRIFPRYCLKMFTFVHYIKLMMSNLRVFDLSLPIILNLSLFTFWVHIFVS